MTAPVVLVAGFWHASWCWAPLAEELAGRGVSSVALDVLGHGLRNVSPGSRWVRPFDPAAYATEPSPVAGVTVAAAAADLIDRLERVGQGRACQLVVHSINGVVVAAVAERRPDLVASIVFVSAFVSFGGRSAYDYLALPEMAGGLVQDALSNDPVAIGAFRYDTGAADLHDTLRATFYADVDDVTANAALTLVQPDGPVRIATDVVDLSAGGFGSVPRSYMVCTRDRAVPRALQERIVHDLDAAFGPTDVVTLESSHSPFLSQPGALAEVIATRRSVGAYLPT